MQMILKLAKQYVDGFYEAMELIWKNQHPPSCSTAKFLISSGWQGGFGSEVHLYGQGLALALELGRVYISNPTGPVAVGFIDNTWQTRNPFCRTQNKETLECYYEPWSSCTAEDAMRGYRSMKHPDMFRLHDKDFELPEVWQTEARFATLPAKVLKDIGNHRSIVYVHTGFAETSQYFIPKQVHELLRCSPMSPRFDYYWWRAVSAAYILRPNRATLDKLRSLRKLPLGLKRGESCVAVYVRRGDKHVEMKFVDPEKFFDTAVVVWDKMVAMGVTPAAANKTIFLQSESPEVIKVGRGWAAKNGWRVVVPTLFDRERVSAHLDHKSMRSKRMSGSMRHHDLEYLSMILTLDYASRCRGWVCTLASNYCRLIDELRATVGGKANYPFADLSHETCGKPPCFTENFTDLGYRRRGL